MNLFMYGGKNLYAQAWSMPNTFEFYQRDICSNTMWVLCLPITIIIL